VLVTRLIVQVGATLGAEPLAVGLAQGLERQRQHNCVAKSRFEVEQVVLELGQFVLVIVRFDHAAAVISLGILVELLDIDLPIEGQRLQATRALSRHCYQRRSGHEDPIHHRFESEVQLDFGSFRDRDKCNTQVSWCCHR